jgi:hypothetical protein
MPEQDKHMLKRWRNYWVNNAKQASEANDFMAVIVAILFAATGFVCWYLNVSSQWIETLQRICFIGAAVVFYLGLALAPVQAT